MILGTAACMAPEQARAQSADRRADIWAYGAVLYQILAGKPAFAGDTIADIFERRDDSATPLPARQETRY